jgi:hypothetical protein
MSNEIHVDDFVGDFDDDLVELITIEDVSVSTRRDKKVQKRRRTSTVWKFFDSILGTGDDKLRAKCKLYGVT